jgi:hypothetical protein
VTKREARALAAKHVDQAFKLAELLLPNSSVYEQIAFVDRILRLASKYRML